ncbi:hypothetical protein KBC79_03545 [Candidatus Woesebacteria bacterium]|nr:hypothetical protein [Candidatus Woesebacteria bacterium]
MPQTLSSGPTLTNITYTGRVIVKYGLVVLVLLMVGRVTLNAMVAYWKATHPPPPPPPTVGFGKLPTLQFPDQSEGDSPAEYRLETPTGSLPDYGDRAKVFFVPKAIPNLLADQRAKSLAATYGFVFEPTVLGTELYRFKKTQPIESTLDLNTRTLHFTLNTDFLSRPELLANKTLPNNFQAVEMVKNFLKSTELLPSDVATSAGEVVYLRSLGGELEEAVSLSDADFIQVDLNRTPIDNNFRVYTPKGYQGAISAIITGNLQGAGNIVQLEYAYNTVDYTQVHTYPLRSARTAWQVLQAGEGYIAQPGESDVAVIRSVSMAYYDDTEEQEYLQPIYVFENPDDGFLAFVSALDTTFVQNSPTQ